MPMLISYHYYYHYAKKQCPMKKSVQFLRRSRRPRPPEPQTCTYGSWFSRLRAQAKPVAQPGVRLISKAEYGGYNSGG